MIKDYNSFIGEGFTIDDEIAAIYLRVFKEGGFNKERGDDDTAYQDIDMWHSLSKNERDNILADANFTGFIDETGDYLEIYRIVSFDYLFGSVLDCIDNRIWRNGVADDDTHITVSYSKALPGSDGEQYKYFDTADTDLENNPFIRNGKNVKWKNRVVTQNIEWILDNTWENCVYIKGDTGAKSLVRYTGFQYYKNGKKVA